MSVEYESILVRVKCRRCKTTIEIHPEKIKDTGWSKWRDEDYCSVCMDIIREELEKKIKLNTISFKPNRKLKAMIKRRIEEDKEYLVEDYGEVNFNGFFIRLFSILQEYENRAWMNSR